MKEYAIGLYEKAMPDTMTWEEKMLCARDCGYDYIEISIDETDAKLSRLDWTKEQRQELVNLMFKTGVPIRSMCLSGHRKYPLGAKDPEVREKSLEIMEKAICLAEDLGIRTIQLAGYDAYYEKDAWEGSRELFLENLIRCAEMAARAGVVLGFETMETPFMNTVWKSMFYVEAVGNPWLGVYPDIGNLNNAALSGDNPTDWDLAAGVGHVFALHLKSTKPGIFRNMLFDDPECRVDFAGLIGVAWDMGVRRYVTEMWYLGDENWKDNICTANRTMSALLDSCADK